MTQAVAERVKVDAKALIDDLLSAKYAIDRGNWEFDLIENAVRRAQEVDPASCKPDEVLHVTNLLGMILPLYKAKAQEYKNNPEARKMDALLAEYNRHMADLQDAVEGINHLRSGPDDAERYSRAVSRASLFYEINWQDLPKSERTAMWNRIESVRKNLPSRGDYKRNPLH